MSKTKRARRRDAVATRTAILASARSAFARAGYDGAGVREIARGAGVSAMLVNRYFGSKEQLFAEVVGEALADAALLAGDPLRSRSPGEAIAAALVERTKADAAPLDGLLIVARSASSRRASEIGRALIEQHQQRALAQALRGAAAGERAALVWSLVLGVQVMRQMIGLSPLTTTKPRTLVKLLAPLFRQLIDGT
jgi:AcrR family transcriptional regulator